ncbi:MAG: LysR family transcriptional regulator [Sandaracinaceae bacterium]|nr:LysR family transcriptional regulator [Sandaracinaceae bacterium]
MESSDLAQLVTLDALLTEESVSGAARRLGLSTPAVSHALARLRERFDDPLLVRAGRTMVLTPRALALRPAVRDAVTVAARVFTRPEPFDPARLSRTFALSATDYVLVVVGPALEARVRAGAPGLDLRFVPNAVDDAERLRRGETDLAVGIYGELPPELRTRVLLTDRLVCVVREGHPRVGRRLGLDAFVRLDHVQVAPRGQPGGYLDDALAERGLARRVVRAVPYFQVALAMVAASDDVLTVSERIARALAPGLGLRIVEPPLPLAPFALSMVWHPRFDADAAHAWLRERLVDAASEVAPVRHEGARRRLDAGEAGRRRRPRR